MLCPTKQFAVLLLIESSNNNLKPKNYGADSQITEKTDNPGHD